MFSGTFGALGRSYLLMAGNAFAFARASYWIFMPVCFALAGFYFAILLPVSALFCALIVLDLSGRLVDGLRARIVGFMEWCSQSVEGSWIAFILGPALLLALAPVFALSLFVPKVSSQVAMLDVPAGAAYGIVDGSGAFRRIRDVLALASRGLFARVRQTYWLFRPLAWVVACAYALALGLVNLALGLFLPLDWISGLIEGNRRWIVQFVDQRQARVRWHVGSFLFTPLFLVALAPVFLAMLLVPKFAGHIESG